MRDCPKHQLPSKRTEARAPSRYPPATIQADQETWDEFYWCPRGHQFIRPRVGRRK